MKGGGDGRIDRKRLQTLSGGAERVGWEQGVLLGMGGSSPAAGRVWDNFGQQRGYSALSYFGMVPAALLGLDFETLLNRGVEMQEACAVNVMGINHPGIWLGAIMGILAQNSHDKLTLVTSPEIASLSDWIEQLVAE